MRSELEGKISLKAIMLLEAKLSFLHGNVQIFIWQLLSNIRPLLLPIWWYS